jgi:hypothetical protein
MLFRSSRRHTSGEVEDRLDTAIARRRKWLFGTSFQPVREAASLPAGAVAAGQIANAGRTAEEDSPHDPHAPAASPLRCRPRRVDRVVSSSGPLADAARRPRLGTEPVTSAIYISSKFFYYNEGMHGHVTQL